MQTPAGWTGNCIHVVLRVVTLVCGSGTRYINETGTNSVTFTNSELYTFDIFWHLLNFGYIYYISCIICLYIILHISQFFQCGMSQYNFDFIMTWPLLGLPFLTPGNDAAAMIVMPALQLLRPFLSLRTIGSISTSLWHGGISNP